MSENNVSQVALLAEIQAQIAEAGQVALLAELANQHSYVSQLAHVNEVDPIMVRAGQLAHINELDPIMVRAGSVTLLVEAVERLQAVGQVILLVELEPTPRPVGRDDELSQAAVGETVTGVTPATTGGAAGTQGATASGAATGQGAASGSSTSGTAAQQATDKAAAQATSATSQSAASTAANASESAASAASSGASSSASAASSGASSSGATGASASDAAASATGGAETPSGTSATGSAAAGTAGSAASGGSTAGATPTGATSSGGQPGQPGAASAGGVAAGVSAAIAAAGAQAPTVSRGAAAAQNELFAALAASRAAVAPGTVLSAGLTGASGVSETRSVVAAVYVDWDRNGVFTNESAYLISARGSANLTAPEQMLAGGRGQVASCTVVLDNKTRRFSPMNSSGALYAYIANGGAYMLPVLVDVTLDGTTHTLFTGYIRELTESAPTPTQTGRVTLECRAKDEKLLQDKLSTPLSDFLADSAAAHTEDYHIINLLETAGMVDGTDFVSPAYALAHPGTLPTIDTGIFPIQYVWLDDESVLDEIWQLVAACCGWFYCDHLGKFHYHNLTAVLPDALERQYGAITTLALDEEQVAGLQLKWPVAELYNEVAVEVAPRAPGEAGEIWTPDEAIVVQPKQLRTIWARLDSAQAIAPTRIDAFFTSAGIPVAGDVYVTQTNYAQRVKLEIYNDNTFSVHFNTLQLVGQTLTGGRTLEVEQASAQAFWTARPARRRSIRNNIYIQSEAQAETVAAYALKRQELPVLMATVPGVDNPALRLAYPVSVEYSNVVPAATTITGIVSGLTWRLDNTGFHQDVTVLETASLFAAYAPIFVLGTHKLGASGTGTAYLFY